MARRPQREPEATGGSRSWLTSIGLSYEHDGIYEEAIRNLVGAATVLERGVEDLRLEEFLAGNLSSSAGAVYPALIDLLARHGRTQEAFDYAERARARAFLLGIGNPKLEPRQGADPALVREAEDLRQQLLAEERRLLQAPSGGPASTSKRDDLRERYRSLWLRLKVSDPAHRERARIDPARIDDIRAALDADTTLVSYFVSRSAIQAWVLDRDRYRHFTLPLNRDDLERAGCWLDELARRGRGVTPLASPCAGGPAVPFLLHLRLITPLQPETFRRRLLIAPHDRLHSLPFAALCDPKTRRFLIEDHVVSYLPSAGVLPILRAAETPVEGSALVLGAPAPLDTTLEPLPGARDEAAAVAHLLATRPLLGAEATESRLYNLAGNVDLLHVAAHGLYEPRNPPFSRIALTPTEEQDGNLEVHEILENLDLAGVNLVVLSACDTARGEASKGDEITGLTRAFLLAGSPGVISTLWRIDDTATALLMDELYGQLIAGATAAEALRTAQLRLRSRLEYSDPQWWAAFTLTGDPQGRWGR